MYINKEGFTSASLLWQDIVNELVANGFNLVSVNGLPGNATDASSYRFVLDATVSVDPLAVEQPWRIHVEIENGNVSVCIATPKQISEDGSVYSDANGFWSGALATLTESDALNGTSVTYELGNRCFHSDVVKGRILQSNVVENEELGNVPVSEAPLESADPMSYSLVISDHGIALTTWVEARDGDGDKFNWFVAQRMVDENFNVFVEDKAPLVCLYSVDGGGSLDANTVRPEGILKFIVREKDVHVPTLPISAVVHTADSEALLNPIQQISIATGNRYIMRFVRNITTQRHLYPLELDLIGYLSADVASQDSAPVLTRGAVDNQRKFGYIARNANSKHNKGMRLMLQTSVETI